jgi:hypothetical protein
MQPDLGLDIVLQGIESYLEKGVPTYLSRRLILVSIFFFDMDEIQKWKAFGY